MGKGKGKLAGWAVDVPAGIFLFEFKNLRHGRAVYFCQQIIYRLPVKAKIIQKFNRLVPFVWNASRKVNYNTFW